MYCFLSYYILPALSISLKTRNSQLKSNNNFDFDSISFLSHNSYLSDFASNSKSLNNNFLFFNYLLKNQTTNNSNIFALKIFLEFSVKTLFNNGFFYFLSLGKRFSKIFF